MRPDERIAAAQAARQKVDNQGRPLGPPTKYTYDRNGLLTSAEPGEEDVS